MPLTAPVLPPLRLCPSWGRDNKDAVVPVQGQDPEGAAPRMRRFSQQEPWKLPSCAPPVINPGDPSLGHPTHSLDPGTCHRQTYPGRPGRYLAQGFPERQRTPEPRDPPAGRRPRTRAPTRVHALGVPLTGARGCTRTRIHARTHRLPRPPRVARPLPRPQGAIPSLWAGVGRGTQKSRRGRPLPTPFPLSPRGGSFRPRGRPRPKRERRGPWAASRPWSLLGSRLAFLPLPPRHSLGWIPLRPPPSPHPRAKRPVPCGAKPLPGVRGRHPEPQPLRGPRPRRRDRVSRPKPPKPSERSWAGDISVDAAAG